ncbi:MAG TPA: DNA topoisomerase [Propionibacteriaceae bacterium]|nr:DNA topoisomerase [Propionibacteriaceae bacterium]HBY22152.1 DNA topoisomerase [Propionibacteriaceae bacterium]
MPRLRHVSPGSPGWTRRRAGRGFSYRDETGRPLPPDAVARIRSLVIPPAWQDVWICPHPNGHLQATGTDAAGRRQYLYHPQWRARRDRGKFDRVASAAVLLPQARRRISADLRADGLPLTKACAAAARLLDVGYFRVGNDAYTDANGSFGLTTLERQHVRRRGSALVFSFVGKSGISHTIAIEDAEVIAVLDAMRHRRDGGTRLLAHGRGGSWKALTAADVNAYLAELFGGTFTAKDFRTWHATVIAAEVLALSEEPATSAASRRRAVRQAVLEVSSYLGNTPTIARASYIDPRIIELYERGTTIADAAGRRYRTPSARRAAVEAAVLGLIGPDGD